MDLKTLGPKIYGINFPTQYALCSTFMRLQEFYESPINGIRDHFFTLEQYMDAYAASRGNFTYTKDWIGFNVPGTVIRKFFETFGHDLLEKEKRLQATIQHLLDDSGRFYLIGTFGIADAMNHEMAHGFWHVSNNYKQGMRDLIEALPKKEYAHLRECIKAKHYADNVVDDELQAFMSTSGLEELRNIFPLISKRKLNTLHHQFKKLWEDTNGQYGKSK